MMTGEVLLIDRNWDDVENSRPPNIKEVRKFRKSFPVTAELLGVPDVWEPKVNYFLIVKNRREELMQEMGIKETDIIEEYKYQDRAGLWLRILAA